MPADPASPRLPLRVAGLHARATGSAHVAALALAAGLSGNAAAADELCAGRGTNILVRVDDHRLYLCEAGKTVESFPVALGRGGVGKTRTGDRKTPLGVYGVGAPRASAKFGTFVPVEYPTAQQRAAGFTGSDVGIHGPARMAAWLGRWSTWVDWTQGCIAVGTDEEIGRIAAFVRDRKPAAVRVESP